MHTQKRALAALCFTALLAVTAAADDFRIPTPWGDIKGNWKDALTILGNPASRLNITGIPTPGDAVSFVIQHPDAVFKIAQDPRYAAYAPVAVAITAARNAAVNRGVNRIPPSVRQALAGIYPTSLLDSVRWTTNYSVVQNSLAAAQMSFNPDTKAITFINVVVFRDSDAANNVALWAHELIHVRQYRDWGVYEFAKRWTDNSSTGGPVEAPAYAQQAAVASMLQSSGSTFDNPINTSSQCWNENNLVAHCDLWAATNGGSARFLVSGEARATAGGHNRGSMALVLFARGLPCNSGAGKWDGVDTATELRGLDYICDLTVQPGETVHVLLFAPNYRADAAWIRSWVQPIRVR